MAKKEIGEREIGETYGDDKRCFFWLDLFVVPQATQVTPPLAWWATAFFHAIAFEPYFVIVAFEWDAPRCFTRCWCLWEIYAAIRAGRSVRDGTLRIALPNSQHEAFESKLLDDVHEVQKVVLRTKPP